MNREELVEEILREACKTRCDAYIGNKCQMRPGYKEKRCIPFLMGLITHTLKAVVDGDLELPNQQWRADFEGYIDKKKGLIDGHLKGWEGNELKPVCQLIALRPEGQEEEKLR